MTLKLPNPTGPLPVSFTDIVSKPGVDCTSFRIYYPTEEYDSARVNFLTTMEREYFDRLRVHLKGVALLTMGVPFNLPLVMPENLDKLPIILFSHGLLVSKDVYTFICSDLASYGYLVAAVNHNDDSLPVTYYVEKGTDSGIFCKKWVYTAKFTLPEASEMRHTTQTWGNVEIRVQELQDVMNSLEMLNEGKLSSILYPDFDLMQFQGRLSTDKATVIGHSLGGATAIAYLAEDSRIKLAVALDPWMIALDDQYLRRRIEKPIMVISCSGKGWETMESNAMRVRLLIDTDTTAERLLVTLLETTHFVQTDLCFLPQSNLQSLNFVAKNDAQTSNSVNTDLIMSFLGKYLGLPVTTDDVTTILQRQQKYVTIGSDLDIAEADLAAAKKRIMNN